METRPELRSIFTTDNQILLATFDNINGIDAPVRRRCILTYLVFIGTVKYTQRPGCISKRIGTVQLRIDIERREVKRIRRLHLAVARAIVIALAEFRKELFAQVLEHFSIKATERKTEAVPNEERSIEYNFLKCKPSRTSQAPFTARLFGNVLD